MKATTEFTEGMKIQTIYDDGTFGQVDEITKVTKAMVQFNGCKHNRLAKTTLAGYIDKGYYKIIAS